MVTTAPSTKQVELEIWKEIRKQYQNAKEPLLPGLLPVRCQWRVSEDWYAIGYATDKGGRFRGKHGPNMLFIFDEATDIPSFVWEETDNMCTAPGNKIVAVGNPIKAAGPFYDCFKSDSEWHTLKISCLDHPNVIYGEQIFPGAVSRQWVIRRIKKYCSEILAEDVDPAIDFEWPKGSGKWYKPSAPFQCRVMGEFPTEGPDILVSCTQVIYSRTRPPIEIDENSLVDIGLDVAYQGGDACVLMARRGPCVIARRKWYGRDPSQTIRHTLGFCKELNMQGLGIGSIAVDAIGIGSGVASGLREHREEGTLKCLRVLEVQVSERARLADKYSNQRAELAFALSERFRQGEIDLTRLGDAGDDFESQAPQIKWEYDTKGRYKIEAKDKIRERTGISPDDFDAMMLCFIDTTDRFAEDYVDVMMAA